MAHQLLGMGLKVSQLTAGKGGGEALVGSPATAIMDKDDHQQYEVLGACGALQQQQQLRCCCCWGRA